MRLKENRTWDASDTFRQILAKLCEAETLLKFGSIAAAIIQHLAVSEQTCHRWRQQHGVTWAIEAKRLKEFEHHNLRLKKAIAAASGSPYAPDARQADPPKELREQMTIRGVPRHVRCDNDPE